MDDHAWQRELEESERMESRAREILRVKPGASREGLRSAYRRAARKSHPDVNQGAPETHERFKDALAAYKFLVEGVRDRRLLGETGDEGGPDGSGYCLGNDWGYYLWWRNRFF